MKTKKLNIVFVIDQSGSMHGTEGDVIGGFNKLLNDHQQSKNKDNITLSTYFFNEQTHRRTSNQKIADVQPLSNIDYRPGGSTALLDSMGIAITETARDIEKRDVLMVVITDGHENASREYEPAKIKALVEEKEKEGWEFMYLGADFSDFANARSMGIRDAMRFGKTRMADAFYNISEETTQHFMANESRSMKPRVMEKMMRMEEEARKRNN